MRLNEDARTPNSSDPAGSRMSRSPWDICTAALLARRSGFTRPSGQDVSGDRAEDGEDDSADDEDVAQSGQVGQAGLLRVEEVDGHVARANRAAHHQGRLARDGRL